MAKGTVPIMAPSLFQWPEVIFSPRIPISSSTTEKIRSAVAGSRNSTMPMITAPSTPMPVHMA